MRWAIEAYERLIAAQQNQPAPEDEERARKEAERQAVNARIRRRLPKVI